ncbi:hypothetical protein Poli38472_014225 [Pythium oligandrum]|uniref:Uncharacterized protein n=1 Tax=Pythium oligandrum TaxID=41045 RepID=A0A8K1FMY7_PYTOL|nr:hypothetical protein Poli38472_014225 [Pythium oligandrum]|eukprot:TMW64108.1 hypothetical protein Poli38472_014225 [Pythium oligandrum]
MDRRDAAPQSSRSKLRSNESQARPITTIGTPLFELRAIHSSPRSTLQPLKASTASTASASRLETTEGEFDVRKILLDQKGSEPIHQSALFRPSSVIAEATRLSTLSTKKMLPRMERDNSKSMGQLPSTNQTSGDGIESGDTVCHFYTIEKMAESCAHAVQSKNKTWKFLPGSEERSKRAVGGAMKTTRVGSSGGAHTLTGLERPSRRVDVMDLDVCFETAMHFVQKHTQGDAMCPDKLALLDRDIVTIQTDVAQRFRVESRTPEADPQQKKTQDDQHAIVKLLLEQKWSDVVMGELEAMLTNSFLEQGALLRKTRIQYAKAFFKLEKLYGARTNELHSALDELDRLRQELSRVSETHEQSNHDTQVRYQAEIQRLNASFESQREDMERKVTEAKEQMTKMGDAMKTLNTIFRQMREDTEKVKAVELRENYIKLEKKYESCREELERLRPLVQINQKLHEQKASLMDDNQALKDKIASFDPILAAKDEVIANLMEEQSELIAAHELRLAQEEERRRQLEAQVAADAEEDEDGDHVGYDAGSSGKRPRGAAVVCVRCKQDLREMSQVGGLVPVKTADNGANAYDSVDGDYRGSPTAIMEPKKRRIQCLYFRILLPNLRGRRPQREAAWTFSCMRAILLAKQLDDAVCKRSEGPISQRIRMPEFVYAWFSPWKSLKDLKQQNLGEEEEEAHAQDEYNDDGSVRTTEQRHQMADEDRWCLYYGVKALVQEGYLEAKLFLSLLDEKYGEDEQVFMLYCYRILDVLIGGKLSWGPLHEHVSYETFRKEYERLFPRSSTSLDGSDSSEAMAVPKIPKTAWISPYHASLATSVVLSKATEGERAAIDKKLAEFAVINLPEDERPAVYLTPTTAKSLYTPEGDYQQQRGHRTQDEEMEDTEANASDKSVQFIDANLWVELMMMEYKEEQAHRRAAIRLMFQTATSAAASPSRRLGSVTSTAMDMEQFRVMLHTLNEEIPSFTAATLYRTAYLRGNGAVTFDSFMEAAEYAQFFSSCMRLESPALCVARLAVDPHAPTQVALSTSSRAAFMVDKYYAILHHDVLAQAVATLPLWTRSVADALSFEVASLLGDGGDGAFPDGVRLLTAFHRLLDLLVLTQLTKHDVTGVFLSSKSVTSFEKTLQLLLECVRMGDKSSIEILIDTVKQTLCVKRMQRVFRLHLQRDEGAPLVMRPLLHHGYGNNVTRYRTRRAERSLQWLHYVISDVLRRSMRNDRLHALLLELSSISSVLLLQIAAYPTQVSWTVNGGIGPAPKPLLVEIIYDYFTDKFGSRWEAEKLIHDVYVNCRAFVSSSPLVLLFTYLCCMSDASPDDRIMGQNEALVFLHGIFRCGVHSFHAINPAASAVDGAPDAGHRHTVEDGGKETDDLIPRQAAEQIVMAAFYKLSEDQKQRVRERLRGQPLTWRRTATSDEPSVDASASEDAEPCLGADAFLVFALHEWKRYIIQRMNEIRVICCTMEEEASQFEKHLHIDFIASVLQKANITFSNDELCAVFRRLCATQPRGVSKVKKFMTEDDFVSDTRRVSTDLSVNTQPNTPSSSRRTPELLSDRLAAACYPLLARETLLELQRLEYAAVIPFKLHPHVQESAHFLVETWRAYNEPCRELLEELRRIGKNNDIQAEAISRRTPVNGGRAIQREVLYFSSSQSSDVLSSQDVAQLEALFTLFLDRLERTGDEPKDEAWRTSQPHQLAVNTTRRMSFVGTAGRNGSAKSVHVLDEEARGTILNARVVVVNETWKMFRQVLVGFARLRALAHLGSGPLPDHWETNDADVTAIEAA